MAEPNNVSREEVRSRRISSEEKISELLDRANLFRTAVDNPRRVEGWSECLEALADLAMPWAQEEDAQAKAKKKGQGQFLKEWAARPVAVITTTTGRIIVPTASDCREAQRILMGLFDRQGLLVSRRTVSGPAPRGFGAPTEPAPPVEEDALDFTPKEELLEFTAQ